MITIRAGDATAAVDAGNGGRIATLRVGDDALLVERAPGHGPMQWGSFPMVPWAGRVRDGRFTFAGRLYELPIEAAPHAIHGTAYLQEWHVDGHDDRQVSLGCDLAWELGGRSWQRISLRPEGLVCVLGVVAGADAMPVSIGWHPWFVKPTTIGFRPASMYLRDDDGIPTGQLVTPPPGPWDDCFVNVQPVELHYQSLTVTVTSDCGDWVVYDEPPHATCVEPQSGPPDAFNLRPDVLQPGAELVRTMIVGWRRPAG